MQPGDNETSLQTIVSGLQSRGPRCCATVIQLTPPEQNSSRRRKLWELDGHAHCPVVGLCLPVNAVRRLVTKAHGSADEDDYVLHCYAVGAAQHRTLIAENLQRELEQRHTAQIHAAAQYKTEADLHAWWQVQRFTPSMAGALWAALTHPRCTAGLERRVLADVHMQQHDLGQSLRAQADRLQGLQKSNAELVHQKNALQSRVDNTMRQLTQEREALNAELVRLRGQLLVRDATVSHLQDELRELRRDEPDLPQRKALAQQVSQQNEQLRNLQRALHQAKHSPSQPPDTNPCPRSPTSSPEPAEQPVVFFDTRRSARASLQAQAVLCVGGRTAAVPAYRRVVENVGARFMHHDGGEQDNPQRLAATLAAADLVICQTGCISHDAYWRVKDHCKRTGTRCVFVNNPSSSSLSRALEKVAQLAVTPGVPA